MYSVIRKLFHYLNLEAEIDNYDKIHEDIEKGVVFKGTNLWILMFAIVVASVGLNMNSTAVIIGAMLISPLMGPINGMGYSLATYNFPLFRKSIKNFTFAVIMGLIASTTYFFLSPISTAHSELLARTSPTIYDVLIALFGGLAGIVAISSKQKGNVIPGVAIATALMPPLCTAGYGLATGKFNFFFGAIYLFTINTVFIALSSLIISQVLKFPIRTVVEESQRKKINKWITIVIIIVLFPSIYFGYKLVLKEKFISNSSKYISSIKKVERNYLLTSEVNPDKRTITLVYGGITMNEEQKQKIKSRAFVFSLKDAVINIQQGLTVEPTMSSTTETERLNAEVNKLNLELHEKNYLLDSIYLKSTIGKDILSEIRNLYPQITKCYYSESSVFSDTTFVPKRTEIILFTIQKSLTASDKQKIINWLKTRLKSEDVKVFYEK